LCNLVRLKAGDESNSIIEKSRFMVLLDSL
jgi:hypothetical protein